MLSINKEHIVKDRLNENGDQKVGESSGLKKTVTFSNMVLVNLSRISSMADMKLGPLVDDGASYSAIGIVELHILYSHIGNVMDFNLDPVTAKLREFTNLQYGSGNHTSART